MTSPYEDIIHLSRPISRTRRPMPRPDRAAQFAPFSALTGLDEALEKTARRHLEQHRPPADTPESAIASPRSRDHTCNRPPDTL